MKVLAGFLQSPEGTAAMDRAAAEARERGGELHLVAYIEHPTTEDSVQRHAAEQRRVQGELDKVVADFQAAGLSCAGHLPRGQQRPSSAVLGVAGDEDVDLIVIGLRQRSRVGKLILGSNAQDILLGARCAVLSVKADVAAGAAG